MKFSIKKIIAGSLFLAATTSYAIPLSPDSKFNAITYDSTGKRFIAVGTSSGENIVAVSADGRSWTQYSLRSHVSPKIDSIVVNNKGDAYLLGSNGSISVRPSGADRDDWVFHPFPSPTDSVPIREPIIVPDLNSADTDVGVSRVGFYRDPKTRKTKGVIEDFARYDGRVLNNTDLGNVDDFRPDTFSVQTRAISSSKLQAAVSYVSPSGSTYTSTGNKFNEVSFCTGSYSFPRVMPRRVPLIFGATQNTVAKAIDICIANAFSSSKPIAVSLSPSSVFDNSRLKIDFTYVAPFNNDGQLPFVIAMSDGGAGVALTWGIVDIGGDATHSDTIMFDSVAQRTCAARSPDGLIVMLGNDNKAMLSSDGKSWTVKTMQ